MQCAECFHILQDSNCTSKNKGRIRSRIGGNVYLCPPNVFIESAPDQSYGTNICFFTQPKYTVTKSKNQDNFFNLNHIIFQSIKKSFINDFFF